MTALQQKRGDKQLWSYDQLARRSKMVEASIKKGLNRSEDVEIEAAPRTASASEVQQAKRLRAAMESRLLQKMPTESAVVVSALSKSEFVAEFVAVHGTNEDVAEAAADKAAQKNADEADENSQCVLDILTAIMYVSGDYWNPRPACVLACQRYAAETLTKLYRMTAAGGGPPGHDFQHKPPSHPASVQRHLPYDSPHDQPPVLLPDQLRRLPPPLTPG